jgi:DNA-binding NarL/FixJ family response regulator
VATHVSAVLRKLGLKSRREVAAALAEVEGRAET